MVLPQGGSDESLERTTGFGGGSELVLERLDGRGRKCRPALRAGAALVLPDGFLLRLPRCVRLIGGRTITVYETQTGDHVDTLFSAYRVDHILLSPDGNEFWATSNYEGAIYVFDAHTRERKDVIQMPGGGDLHGLVWVHYDQDGVATVVRDQGGFHNDVDPGNGRPLAY